MDCARILLIFLFLKCSLLLSVEKLKLEIIRKIPHTLPAFTQGLSIQDGALYESTGLYGHSELRKIDIESGNVIQRKKIENFFFAEGVAAFPGEVIQITWNEMEALVYDRQTLTLKKVMHYSGAGWGLCRDGNHVWMSNGTSQITKREVSTFKPVGSLNVVLDGKPLNNINDLECVGNYLFANIWFKNWIARIDKATGEVDGIIEGSSLLQDHERARLNSENVLNGIAHSADRGTFFITGKEWPWIYEVDFIRN